MSNYETCNNNALIYKQKLPSSDIYNITFLEKEGYLGLLYIQFVIYQDVFYPVTETVKLYINTDKSYKIDSPISKDIPVKEINRIVTALTESVA
jgi:hypothetical protein